MKRKTSKILFFICLAVFLIGITLLAMPFEFENYSYSNSPSSTLNVHDKHGFKFSVNIKNYTDEELENVKVEVRYSYKEELVKYASLMGNYSGDRTPKFFKYIPNDYYETVKDHSLDVYSRWAIKDAEFEPFCIPKYDF